VEAWAGSEIQIVLRKSCGEGEERIGEAELFLLKGKIITYLGEEIVPGQRRFDVYFSDRLF